MGGRKRKGRKKEREGEKRGRGEGKGERKWTGKRGEGKVGGKDAPQFVKQASTQTLRVQ